MMCRQSQPKAITSSIKHTGEIDQVRLSDLEPLLACQACGRRPDGRPFIVRYALGGIIKLDDPCEGTT